jgi:hypothetical protein
MDKQTLIQNVCENCPATKWGASTTCHTHGCHVGKVSSCPQWEKYMNEKQDLVDHKGQLAFTDLQPAIELVQRTEEELRDYHFMVREIERIKSYLEDAGEGMIGQYGIDASLPRAIGVNGDKTQSEVIRRERKWRRLQRLQDTVDRIERAMATITDDKELAVLEGLMDGEKNNFIARHIGVSRQRYYEIKRIVITKMAWAMYGDGKAA